MAKLLADPTDDTSSGIGGFLRDPVNVGLLSALFGGLAGANRYAPINSIGKAGISGLLGYQNALPASIAQKQMDVGNKYVTGGDTGQASAPVVAATTAPAYGIMSPAAFGPQGVGSDNQNPATLQVTQVQPTLPASPIAVRAPNPYDKIPRAIVGTLLSQGNHAELAKMAWEANKPDMQVANGYAYNKNDVKPGFLPQLNMSQDGKTSMVTLDANGNPVVAAPNGALPTFNAYQNATEAAKARFDLIPMKSPVDGKTYMMTKEQAAGLVSGTQPAPAQNPGAQSSEDQAAIAAFNAAGRPDSSTPFNVKPNGQGGVVPVGQVATPTQVPAKAPSFPPIGASSPFGVGIPVQSESDVKYNTDLAADAAKATSALNSKVSGGADLLDRLNEQRANLANFTPGAGADMRLGAARWAKSFGASNSIVNGIAGGDVGAMQAFQKTAAAGAIESLKQAAASGDGNAGRIMKSEVDLFLKVNPNLETDPDAINKIYNFQERQHRINLAEQQAQKGFVDNGGSPAAWAANWSLLRPTVAKQVDEEMKATPTPAPAPKAPAQTQTTQPTGNFSVSAGGKLYSFPDQKSLNNFKLSAGIK